MTAPGGGPWAKGLAEDAKIPIKRPRTAVLGQLDLAISAPSNRPRLSAVPKSLDYSLDGGKAALPAGLNESPVLALGTGFALPRHRNARSRPALCR